jgi:hypothetical protein
MSDTSFGSGIAGAIGPTSVGGAPLVGGGPGGSGADVPPAAPGVAPAPSPGFGSSIASGWGGPRYNQPDPQASALDQSASLLEQRIKRANDIAADPLKQFFNPEGVQKARDFVPQAAEKLQQIRTQQAQMQANRQQAETLGLHPGEVPDEATQADRVEVAKARALKGDLKVFKGLQAVDPKSAEAIQDQVHEVVAGHLTKAQLAFDSLSYVQNQGQYTAKLAQLRKDGTLTDLEALGLKVPDTFEKFGAAKAREGQALREARIGLDSLRQKLEDRNTYLPMEEKEAKTYEGRIKTVYGDNIPGTWARNGSSNTRGLIVPGMADPRTAGPMATLEQRKGFKEDFAAAVPKDEMEKFRAFNRTHQLATLAPKDGQYDDGKGGKVTLKKGDAMPEGTLNTNPNVQQGVAEGLASMLRGGLGGANVGLLKIEDKKRAALQTALDTIKSNYAGAINTITGENAKSYLTGKTQEQIRDVLDALKAYNDKDIGERTADIARRAGALRLDAGVFGFNKGESAGAVDEAIKEGRAAQIAEDMKRHQSIGGGDGVLQIGAQRAGAGATALPPGTTPTNQLPGGDRIATPVQQAGQPPGQPGPGVGPAGPQSQVPPPPNGGGNPPPVGSPPVSPAPTGGGAPTGPVQIAGQPVTPPPIPGASPGFLAATQRIESGNEKTPWTAGNDKSSAKGAFQFINSTWADNKPAGAPDDPRKATPQQQTEAVANLANKNGSALKSAGLPVNDTTLYMAHNLGAGGATALLHAGPNADARTVIGEAAARNNPLFFKGRPTVATVLQRYVDEVEKGGVTGGGVADVARHNANARGLKGTETPQEEKPGLLTRISRALSQGVPGSGADKDKAVSDVGNAAVEHAPAIGSTAGAVVGSLGGPAGAAGLGGAGGAAGQSLKDYLRGRSQDPKKLIEQGALGAVLGVGSAARPVLAAGARMAGAGGVEAGAEAARGGGGEDILEAGMKGAGLAAGGEAFGRALGMAGHKVFSLFSPDAKKAVQSAASKFHDAEEVLRTEQPKLAGAGGASTPNPKYEAAQAAKEEAERTLKDAGIKPEEAAYAHKVSFEGVPKQEAEVGKPGAAEQKRIGEGYKQLENEVGAAGVGSPKASPKLPDGPRAAVENKKVSAAHAELAERVEAAITAPAKNWQEKWTQLKDARSDLLQAERDAMSSTVPGRSQTAKDMRTLADTVRTQQEKAATHVFGAKDGPAFMDRLKVLDVRYRSLMEATNGGDLAKAASMKGEAGRDVDRKFRALANDDPAALSAWDTMRKHSGADPEKTVPWTVVLEGLPVVKHLKLAVLASMLKKKIAENVAGNPVRFTDIVKTNAGAAEVGQSMRDLAGTAVQRGAVTP